MKFCGHCAAQLDAVDDGHNGVLSGAPLGELKQVSILFCDMVDSTAVAERRGAEAMHELIRWFIDTALEEVYRYGGTVPQFSGDGFMALFGVPIAHEDHVRRALLAAVGIRQAISGGGAEAAGREAHQLRLHMGVHTGLVVFGPVGGHLRMDPTVIGDAANIAARLQQAADPGTILISEEMRLLARGYVQTEPAGPLTLKGKTEPIMAHRLIGVSHHFISEDGEASSRPLVNRTGEMDLLCDLLGPVEAGRGMAFSVVGEPGIGKSRLVTEFRGRVVKAMTWVRGQCLSYGTTIPYLLILDVLRNICGIAEADTPETAVNKLRWFLQSIGMDAQQDALPLLRLLGIETRADAPALSSPEAVKEQAFAILRQLFLKSSIRRPLVLILEDMHWIDKLSEEFIGFLAESISIFRILLLATYRPGYRPPWLDQSHADELLVRPLSPADSRDVVRAARPDLETRVTEEIINKADGNPLFLEQLALHAGEAPDDRAIGMVPNTIHDVVMARLDLLPEETKRLLQAAAVIGREFSNQLLRSVWQGANPIEPQLRELARLEFIDEQGGDGSAAYVFRHALTRETAYSSLLERHRRRLHAAVGNAMERHYGERVDEVVEQLAYHFDRSDEAEKAVDFSIQAADKAQRRWANDQALAFFAAADRRLDGMPDTEPNRLRRLDSVLKQADVRYGLAQYNEHLQALERVRGIVEATRDARRRATWYYWSGLLHSVTGSRSEIAIDNCRTAANIAAGNGFQDVEALASACLAQVYITAGRPREAVQAGERALAYFEACGDRWWAARTLWFLSTATVYLGQWATSLQYCRRALEHGAAAKDDPRFRSVEPVGLWRMGFAYIEQGDLENGLKCCDTALALASILPRDTVMAAAVRGYGEVKAGRLDAGIAALRKAVAWLDSSGFRYTYLTNALWLAEGYLRQGDPAGAQTLIQHILDASTAGAFPLAEGRARSLMANCIAAKDRSGAEDQVESSIRIFERVEARNDLAKALFTRAALRQRAGDRETARALLDRAGALFRELGTLDEPRRVLAGLTALDAGEEIPLLGGAAGDRRAAEHSTASIDTQ
jgi:class 3 adenylate cyclase/tetratricopeptide (TPR) repeat protein